tara:strand:+ start:7 stop:597 length:591 start_codon:yes stop_codon:yes gene_type:complete
MKIIDLFSGSGSATGIWENNGHDVYRYDIVTHSKIDTIPIDLSDLDLVDILINEHKNTHIDLIWASPPCPEYSTANRERNKLWKKGILPDLTLWKTALYIIQELKPVYYVIENVAGAVRVWGPPRQRFGPYYLWGVFPKFNVAEKIPSKDIYNKWKPGETHKSRAARAAQIPYSISVGLYRAITLQKTLFTPDYCL